MNKELIYRLPGSVIIELEMSKVEDVIKAKGLNKVGNAQQFHTANVLRRIKRYMPFLTGMTYKVTVTQTDIRKPEIVTNVPYGQYLYRGKKTVNHKTEAGPMMVPGVGPRHRKGAILKPVGSPLEYTRTKNPDVGPYWDRILVAREGRALAADLQRFIDRRNGK